MADWTPAEIPTALWLDANDGLTAALWSDKSGNGRHAIQATATYQPAVVPGALNGLQCARFDGVNDFYSCGDVLDLGSGSHSVFVAAKFDTTTDQALIAKSLYGSAVGRWAVLRTTGALKNFYVSDTGSGSTASVAYTSTAPAVIAGVLARGSTPANTLWVNGSSAGAATPASETVDLNTVYRLLIGAYNNSTDTGQQMYFDGDMYEVIVIPEAVPDSTRQRMEGYLAWKWGLVANLPTDHPYKNAAPIIVVGMVAVSSALVCQYSMIMEKAFVGRYGDAAQLLAGLVGRYGNTLLVKSALVGKYGDLVQVAAALEGRYHLMHARTAALVGEYALCGIELLAGLVGRYDLRERDEIMAALEGYYSLLPGSTIEQILCPVLIGGVLVNWAAVSWTLSEESYLIEATITLRDQAQWRAIAKQDNVTITWHGTTYTLFVATKLRSRSVSGSPGAAEYGADYVVVARSLTNGLDAPYALPTTMAWPVDTMASAIALDLIGSLSDIITLEWQLEDWMQPGGTFFITDQTPLEGLRSLAAIVGGIVQTGPDNSLILRRADVVPPTQWASSLPAWTIEDSGIFSDSESEEQSNLYNVITVTNQSETAETVNFEIEDLSDYRKRVKGYRTPWVDFGLATSGGSWVTIVDDGVVEAEITETVEFVDGSASASKPIYSPVSVTWKQVSLGAVTGSEDGSLIAAIAGCSLAEITYTTKYHAWIGSSDRDETVQFYQVEL